MFTETQTRDRFQWLKPLCVFWENIRQDRTSLSPLFCSSPLEEELLSLSLQGTHTAKGLRAHTHQRKRSKRAGAGEGLLLQRLPWQPADRASDRQNQLHYRPLHGQHCVQREQQSLVQRLHLLPVWLLLLPHCSPKEDCYYLHQHMWTGGGTGVTLPFIWIELGRFSWLINTGWNKYLWSLCPHIPHRTQHTSDKGFPAPSSNHCVVLGLNS